LPIADDHKQINVAIESADDHSHLRTVRRLLALRRAEPALVVGGYHRLTEAPPACLAYVREHEGRQITIVLNFGDDPVAVDVAAAGSSATPPTRVVLCTIEGSARVADGVVHLQARSGALLGHG
jgi:glycosidase